MQGKAEKRRSREAARGREAKNYKSREAGAGKSRKAKSRKAKSRETEIQKLVERVVYQRRNDRGIRCDVSEVQVVLGRLGHDLQS
jgi:ATPase subunit of ABC transporter with duplicated ATPase domains